jgi:glutaredoxin
MESPREHGWTIYTKSNCSFCEKAKQLLLDERPTIFLCDEYLLLNHTIIGEDNTQIKISPFLDFIHQYTKNEHNTFPIVFHHGEYIGGYKETLEYYNKQSVSWSDL